MFRDDEEARQQRIAALERQAARADALERQVRELEQENQQLRERLEQAGIEVDVLESRSAAVDDVYVDDKIHEYVAAIVLATRSPDRHGLAELSEQIASGARAKDATAVILAACRRAAGSQRKFVVPEDVRQVVVDVLRARIVLSKAAVAAGRSPDAILARIVDRIELP